jgi:hypothetical protein
MSLLFVLLTPLLFCLPLPLLFFLPTSLLLFLTQPLVLPGQCQPRLLLHPVVDTQLILFPPSQAFLVGLLTLSPLPQLLLQRLPRRFLLRFPSLPRLVF